MSDQLPSSMSEAVTLRSALLSTGIHGLLVLLMLGVHDQSQNHDETQSPDTAHQEQMRPEREQITIRLPASPDQAPAMADMSPAAPLPELDLDALPDQDGQAISAAPAPSLGNPGADMRLGPLGDDGGLDITLPSLDRVTVRDIAPAMTANASRPDVDQRLREWQNVAEFLQDIILRRNWRNHWQARFHNLITNRDLIASVNICPRGFISRFRLIRGTGVDELDGLIEGFFLNAERLNVPPIDPDNPLQYLHLRLPE